MDGCIGVFEVVKFHTKRHRAYHVSLFFLQLPSAEMAIERVRLRVTQGGHNIPDDVVRRRFDAGLTQFNKTYKPIVNAWFLYNNQHHQPVLLDKGVNP